MIIRDAQLTDEKAITDICFETRAPGVGSVEDSELYALRFALYYLRFEREFCFVAEEDRNVVGYILSTPDTDKQEGEGDRGSGSSSEHLLPLAIHRAHKRRGQDNDCVMKPRGLRNS